MLDNGLYSGYVIYASKHEKAGVFYAKGKETRRHKGCGPLLAFTSLHDTMEFLLGERCKGASMHNVYIAMATCIQSMTCRAYTPLISNVIHFWYNGTIYCNMIRLSEEPVSFAVFSENYRSTVER
jgi:hypothetical protein